MDVLVRRSASALAFLAILFSLFPVLPVQAQTQTWEELAPSPDTVGGSQFQTTITTDASGTPYVAYASGLSVKKWNGTAWELVGTPIGVGAPILDIAIAPDGTPYLAYRSDNGQPELLYVQKFNGTDWEQVGSALTTSRVQAISLAIDSASVPYVAYKEQNGTRAVAVFDGTAWGPLGGTSGVSGVIAFAPDDTLYLATPDATNTFMEVKEFTPTGWQNVGGTHTGGQYGNDRVDLAFDSTGQPYVTFRDGHSVSFGRASVRTFDGTSWQQVGFAGFSSGEVDALDIEIGAGDVPYVAYRDAANGDEMTVRRFDGTSAWEIVGQEGFSDLVERESPDFSIAPNGTLFVSYKEDALNQIRVMRFTGDSSGGGSGGSGGSGECSGAANNGTDSTTCAKISIDGGDISIGAPALILFPDAGVSSTDQTVEADAPDHFFVEDLKGDPAGYYTTLSVSDMADGTKIIPAENMEIKVENGTVDLLAGTADPNVTVPTAIETYIQFPSSAPITLLQRTADSGGILGKYGVVPDFQLTIPAYQQPGDYTAIMTYTLIEN